MKKYTNADKVRFAEYRLADATHIKDILVFIMKSGTFPISEDVIDAAERARASAERQLLWIKNESESKKRA